jgi:hypothetical protein
MTDVYKVGCYICEDPSFARMGLPLCRPCAKCGGHVAADDTVCDDCGHDDHPEGCMACVDCRGEDLDMPETKEVRCPKCGSTNVQCQVWAYPNQDYLVTEEDRQLWATSLVYCGDCKDHHYAAK